MVAGRGHLRDLRAQLRRRQRRRARRPGRNPNPAARGGGPGGRRHLADAVLPVASGRRRLRRRRPPRRRPAVRFARRTSTASLADAHALGLQGARRHRAEPHLERPSLVPSPRWQPIPAASERARYLFRDGRGPDGATPPNDWQSVVRRLGMDPGPRDRTAARASGTCTCSHRSSRTSTGRIPRCVPSSSRSCGSGSTAASTGSASTWPTGWPRMPKLPDTRRTLHRRGPGAAGHPHWDRDEVHDVYRAWRTVSDGYDGDRMFVAEAYLRSPDRLARYVRPDELHTAFNFRFLLAPWDADALRNRHRREHRGDASMSAPRRPGCSRTTTSSATSRGTAVATSVSPAPGPPCSSCWPSRAAPTSTRAMSSACAEVDGPARRAAGRIRPSSARVGPSVAATVAGFRCRGPADDPSFGFSEGATAWLPQPPAWRTLAHHVQRDRPRLDPVAAPDRPRRTATEPVARRRPVRVDRVARGRPRVRPSR